MPRPSIRQRWLAAIILLLALCFAAYLWLRPLLNIGSGYAAKQACSCHFLQGRSLEEISEQDLNFSVLGWVSLTAAREGDRAGSLNSHLLGLVPRRAIYREGIGCTLQQAEGLDFPEEAYRISVEDPIREPELSVTVNDQLAKTLDWMMEPTPSGGARGIVVLQNGQLIGESYAEGFDRTTRLPGWSMTKTLTGLAVGAWLRGTDPASLTDLFPEIWTDERSAISLADLLHMNSGLAWNEAYGAISDATIMLHERPDMAAQQMRQPAVAPPNTKWVYSSGTTNTLMEYLRRELGDNQALYEFLYDSLLHRVAPSLLIEPDQIGRPVGSSYGWATTRDWARLGQLMLQDGIWNGDTLLPPGWIDYMREPAAGSDGIYGAQLWLKGPDTPSLPDDGYAMRGFQDQRVFVIPSRGLVIARLGHGNDRSTDFDALLRRLLTALE